MVFSFTSRNQIRLKTTFYKIFQNKFDSEKKNNNKEIYAMKSGDSQSKLKKTCCKNFQQKII